MVRSHGVRGSFLSSERELPSMGGRRSAAVVTFTGERARATPPGGSVASDEDEETESEGEGEAPPLRRRRSRSQELDDLAEDIVARRSRCERAGRAPATDRPLVYY